jgi:hypothetical protein
MTEAEWQGEAWRSTVFEDIRQLTDFIRPFPEFEKVFGEPVELHRKHLLPLVSVNAKVINADWDFWLHFVTPIEPLLEGNIGDLTGDYHDFYNRCGQIAFRINNGRYTFAGDFRFFAYESGANSLHWRSGEVTLHRTEVEPVPGPKTLIKFPIHHWYEFGDERPPWKRRGGKRDESDCQGQD